MTGPSDSPECLVVPVGPGACGASQSRSPHWLVRQDGRWFLRPLVLRENADQRVCTQPGLPGLSPHEETEHRQSAAGR